MHMTTTERGILLTLAVLFVMVLGQGAYILIHSSDVANAIAEERIKSEQEFRERLDKADAERHKETEQRLAELERRKKEPATAVEVAALLRPYMASSPQQPIVIEHKDDAGHVVPDAPSSLLFEGASLTALRNRELQCQQCETERGSLKKDVDSQQEKLDSMERALKESERARKKTKWQKLKTGIKIGAAVGAGIAIGKAVN